MIEILRKRTIGEEFDYQTLIDCLEGYSNSRAKITQLLRKGIIISQVGWVNNPTSF